MTATIPRLVYDLMQASNERPSVAFRDITANNIVNDRFSYSQLWHAACAFSEVLQDIPIGSHVMLIMPLGKRLLAAHLSTQLQGCVASIFTHPSEKINLNVYIKNLQNAIHTLKPEVIVTSKAFSNHINEIQKVDSFQVIFYEDVMDTSSFEPKHWLEVKTTDPAVIQYSSGSTGLQKCVALSHEMIINQCRSYARFIGLNKDFDHICSWLPLYHDMGLFTTWLMPLLEGIPVTMIDPFQWVKQPLSFLELISNVQGTLCWQPNFAFKLLASRCDESKLRDAKIDLSSMRGFSNCSEPVSHDAFSSFAQKFRSVGVQESMLWTCYAMAENAFAVTASGGPIEATRVIKADVEQYSQGKIKIVSDKEKALTLVSCGIPIEGCQVRVVSNQRELLPESSVGEIAIKGSFLMKEYIRAPELSRQVIDVDGWYYTGDLGFQYNDRLYITGRKKDLLIVGGRNFYPQDLEGICNRFDEVIPGRNVALGLEDPSLGTQKIIIIAESHLTDSDKKSQLVTEIRKQIFDELDCAVSNVYLVPHMWLLKTSSGKIARQPNLEKYRQELEKADLLNLSTSASSSSSTLKHRKPQKEASLLSTIVWSFVFSACIYAYLLVFFLSDNISWNIYAKF